MGTEQEFRKQYLGDWEESQKGKIYAGENVFYKLKESLGILYGRKFSYDSVTVVLNINIPPNDLMTGDPKIGEILEKLKTKV